MSTDTTRPAGRTGPPRTSYAGHLVLACVIAVMLVSTLHETVYSPTAGADPVRVGAGGDLPDPATTAPASGAADRHAQSPGKRPAPQRPIRQPV